MATSMGSPWTSAATTGSPSTARPMTTTALPPEPSVPTHDPTTALTTAPQWPDAETTLEPAAATKPPSTEHSTPQDLVTGSPTARLATTTLPGSSTTSPPAEAQETAEDSISGGSPPAEKGTGLSVGTVPACSLQIWSLPPNGTQGKALRIECHAQCTRNATVRWLRTPVALSQYREEAAGSSSTLRLDHAGPQHQGHYQCTLLGHSSQVVSLQLMVLDGEWWSAAPSRLGLGCSKLCECHIRCWGMLCSPLGICWHGQSLLAIIHPSRVFADTVSTGPAVTVGTTFSLLGLIATSVVSHRLWKRFRSQYELP